jgi:hypothetical protein
MNGAFGPQTAPRNLSSMHYLDTKSPFYEFFWMVEEICPTPCPLFSRFILCNRPGFFRILEATT